MKPIYRLLILIIFYFVQSYTFAQTPCENGMAGLYPCENVDLLFHAGVEEMLGATTNEIWGWTDSLYQKDYVLVGLSTGVRFYDIQNPVEPIYLGILPRHNSNSIWRTFRHLNNYLYVGSEANGHGMQVFDLTRLRNVASPPENFTEDAWYSGFGKCHTLSTLIGQPYVYACGTNSYSGGLHIVNVSNPLAPVIAGGFAEDGYIHETQILQYFGPDQEHNNKILALCFSGNNPPALTIVDVTDPLDMTIISSTTYPNSAYCHQGWLTEDGAYLLMDDELDESNGLFTNTRTLIWDMHDLDNPLYMGDHVGNTAAIDHNQYVRGNLCYQSNYTAGLQILDVTDIADTTLHLVGYFDHYPASNATSFDGEWMNYPYFSSGIVAVTDIDNGFFLLQPNFIQVNSMDTVCANETLPIVVDMHGSFQGPYNLSVQGLPEGTTWTVTWNNNLQALVDISNWPETNDLYTISIMVMGASHHYSRTLQINVIAPVLSFLDQDGDGFGGSNSLLSCALPSGYVLLAGDCDDTNSLVYPNASPTGQAVDNDCNGSIDPDEVFNAFCPDLNNDGMIAVADLLLFTEDYGCAGICIADFNNDLIVNTSDLIILLIAFGTYCEP
jgi:choice-of-anchor B domain-containing protein